MPESPNFQGGLPLFSGEETVRFREGSLTRVEDVEISDYWRLICDKISERGFDQ